MERTAQVPGDRVELYWLPLGAGATVVRFSGKAYERCLAIRDRRPPSALVHAALEVRCDGQRYVIEVAPVWDRRAPDRGVVAEGAVGHRWLGRSRWFRYEVRRWRDGVIPDIAHALGGPRLLGTRHDRVAAVLDLLPDVPTPVWGRDELGTGDMWNSNAVVAWVLARSGHPVDAINLPDGSRAPGWLAGAAVAARADATADQSSARLA
jgi:hypothetical protein